MRKTKKIHRVIEEWLDELICIIPLEDEARFIAYGKIYSEFKSNKEIAIEALTKLSSEVRFDPAQYTSKLKAIQSPRKQSDLVGWVIFIASLVIIFISGNVLLDYWIVTRPPSSDKYTNIVNNLIQNKKVSNIYTEPEQRTYEDDILKRVFVVHVYLQSGKHVTGTLTISLGTGYSTLHYRIKNLLIVLNKQGIYVDKDWEKGGG